MKPLIRFIGCALVIATTLVPTPSSAHSALQESNETISVRFIDPATGWRLTQRWNPNTGTGGPLTLRRTDDGGLHWHRISSLPAISGAHILFADTRDGWLFGSRLYSTHDGGRTWRRIPLHGTQTVVTVSGTSAWRLDSTCSVLYKVCHLSLFASIAGSDSWSSLTRPPVAPGVAPSMTRVGPSVWISGQVPGSTDRMRLALAETTDSGETWQRLPMPCNHAGIGAFFSDVIAHSPTKRWLFCASQPSAGSQAKAVYRSSNGGHTWRLIARSPVFGPPRNVVGSLTGSGYLHNAAVTSPRVAFMTLGRNTIIRTSDGGRTWRPAIPISVADPGGGGVGPVQFVDPGHGWLLSFPSLLFRTTDGGQTWRKIELS